MGAVEAKIGWMIAEAVIDAVAANINRNLILDTIAAKEAEGVAPEEIPAVIRGLREQADAEAQAAIDALRAGGNDSGAGAD